MNYFLDTNILLIYLRDNERSRQVESELNLLSKENNLIQDFLIADINTEDIIERYAEIDAFSQGKLKDKPIKFSSRNMGKNDLWIAATSSVYQVDLITTDNDFDHLNDVYLNLIKVEKK